MAIKKSKIVSRIPNEKILEDAKLDLKTISTLIGKIGVTFSANDEVEVHQSVKKMHAKARMDYSKLSKNEQKRIQEIERIKNKAGAINNKVIKLESSKQNFVNNHKLSHELEADQRRRHAQKFEGKSLLKLPDFKKLNEEVAQTYLQETTNKQKIKHNSKTLKTRNIKKNEVFDLFDTSDSKKFTFKQSNTSKPSSKSTDLLNKIDYSSPSTKHFAQNLGWIENDGHKRVLNSPLHEYKADIKKESSQNQLLETIDQDSQIVDNLNDTLDFERAQAQEEMDLKAIDTLAKKFAIEAEINKKKYAKSVQEFVNVSDIYKKILDQSPISKLSRQNKKINNLPEGVDINKIPSFVLEVKK